MANVCFWGACSTTASGRLHAYSILPESRHPPLSNTIRLPSTTKESDWKPIKLGNPGTKARWSAKSHRSSPRTSGPSESTFKRNTSFATWPCSTWQSTASCLAASRPHATLLEGGRVAAFWHDAVCVQSARSGRSRSPSNLNNQGLSASAQCPVSGEQIVRGTASTRPETALGLTAA